MSKVMIEYDLSPSLVESEIRDKLIELGWQPPGCKPAQQDGALTNEGAKAPVQQEAAALFREAMAFGLAYGPRIPGHQWDEMREEKVAQLVSRLATPQPAQRKPLTEIQLLSDANKKLRKDKEGLWELVSFNFHLRYLNMYESNFVDSAIEAKLKETS